jgi:hypothetical protein
VLHVPGPPPSNLSAGLVHLDSLLDDPATEVTATAWTMDSGLFEALDVTRHRRKTLSM